MNDEGNDPDGENHQSKRNEMGSNNPDSGVLKGAIKPQGVRRERWFKQEPV